MDVVNAHAAPGEIAAVEFNVSCHNVNFPFETILEDVLARAVRRSRHPVLLKLSPDYDYLAHARLAERYGVAGLVAMNTVKGLRLDPRTGEPLLKNRFGGLSGRAIKPIGLRVVAELRDAGIRLPIIASARRPHVRRLSRVLLGRRRRGQPGQRGLAGAVLGLRARVRCAGCRSSDSSDAWRRMSETDEALGRDLVAAAVLRGDFLLRSGARSSYYIDKYLFTTQPDLLRRIAAALAARLPAGVQRVAGPCWARCRW